MYNWTFSAYVIGAGANFTCKVKANSKEEAIRKGFGKACKKYYCSNSNITLKACNLIKA